MTADQFPGGGASPKDIGSKTSLSPEAKVRIDAVNTQIRRVDGVFAEINALGINVTEVTIRKDGTEFSVIRNTTWHEDLNAIEETLMVLSPPYMDDDGTYEMNAFLSVDPVVKDNPEQAEYEKRDKNGVIIEKAFSFGSALQSVSSLLDYLGFPTTKESSLSPDDFDGTSTARAGIQIDIPTDMDDLKS